MFAPVIEVETRMRELADVALRALPAMFDDRLGLFSQKAVLDRGRIVNRGVNPYYSAASMVGILSQPDLAPEDVVPVGKALDALQRECGKVGGGPLLGTALWAGALAGDSRAAALVDRLEQSLAIPRLESAALGQAIKGLIAGADAFPQVRDAALGLADRCAAELLDRHSAGAGIFRAMPRRPSGLRSLIGSRITSFASQVYPLLGLSALYAHRGDAPPAALRRTAEFLVRSQGALGQWWWLYAPSTAAVLEGYPVYSVHQDGMAFMGLVPVQQLGEGSYGKALALGVEWLERNEISTALVEGEPPFICRNVQRAGSEADAPFGLSRANMAQAVARSLTPRPAADRTSADPARLEPLRECRSYHLGWLLYARSLTAV